MKTVVRVLLGSSVMVWMAGGDAAAQCVRRTRVVVLDASAWNLAAAPRRLALDLFDDVSIAAELETCAPTPDGQVAWAGRVVGEPASFVSLVSNGRTLCGSVACAAGDFQIRNAGGPLHTIRQLGLCPVGAARASTMTALEQEVFNLVNVERAAAGLYTLAVDERLVTAARAHSQDMAYRNYFAHDSPPPNPTTFSERITMNGYNWSVCAENIAAGQATAAAVMNTWMNSPGHRANILTTACCDLGVGYATNPASAYVRYWTQDFGRLAGSPPCGSGSLTWETTRSAAMSRGNNEGKPVLLVAGRDTCANTSYMRNTVCATTSPNVKGLLSTSFVLWYCNVDTSTEWYPYAAGLGAYTLPLICAIDPQAPAQYLDRTTGLEEVNEFHARLQAVVTPAHVLPVSFPGQTVCVYVWDNTAAEWLNYPGSGNLTAPQLVSVPNLQANRYYWVGIWAYSAADWAHNEWFGRIDTPDHGRFIGHIRATPADGAIGRPRETVGIPTTMGHTLWPVTVDLTSWAWNYSLPQFISRGLYHLQVDTANPWQWLVFYDLTAGRWY